MLVPAGGMPEALTGVVTVTMAVSELQDLQIALQGERRNSRLWEYRYLNHFLVPKTQAVLDWLIAYHASGLTTEFYLTAWIVNIPSADERRAILMALESHSLIVEREGRIEVTAKAEEYADWRGPFPKFGELMSADPSALDNPLTANVIREWQRRLSYSPMPPVKP